MVVKWLRRSGAAALLVALAAIAAAGCGSSAGTSGSSTNDEAHARNGGTLTIARQGDTVTLDPTQAFDNEANWVFENMYDTLYTASPNGKALVPELAQSYDLSADKRTWTFHLRPGVTFSDGRPLTSADVKFSLDRVRSRASGWSFMYTQVDKVSAPDSSTVVVHTSRPYAPLLADVALFAASIFPNHLDGKDPRAFFKDPVATGPFKLANWTPGRSISVVRNPRYWQPGRPHLDKVTWTVVADDNARVLQLKSGQVQVAEFPAWSQISSLQTSPGVKVGLFPSMRVDFIVMNEKHKPFDDPHVRRAIALAIDRASIVRAVLFGNGQPAPSYLPAAIQYYDRAAGGDRYDPAAARAELAQSSVPHGFSTTLQIGSGIAATSTAAQIIQQELGAIGINVKIRSVDPSSEVSLIQGFQYDMALHYWTSDIVDPDELASFFLSSPGFGTNYQDPQAVRLTADAAAEFDPAQRTQLYAQLQSKIAQDAPMVSLYYSPYAYAYSDQVHGMTVLPTGNYHTEEMWLSR